ncbi:hypothetical protein BaRGS_00023190 [Batillaria attramentaria]|uniref:Transposase n=1 Tax=Batillaria attramentaria TaxID=370345 RepID=A0ABD0KF65_9CAEN
MAALTEATLAPFLRDKQTMTGTRRYHKEACVAWCLFKLSLHSTAEMVAWTRLIREKEWGWLLSCIDRLPFRQRKFGLSFLAPEGAAGAPNSNTRA